MGFAKVIEMAQEVTSKMTTLGWYEFMTIMCELYDEYHAAHPEYDAVEMARTAAQMVERVNEVLGAHEYKEV